MSGTAHRSAWILSLLACSLAGCGFNARERAAIRAEKKQLTEATTRFLQIKDEINHDLQAEPQLFQAGSRDAGWRQRLGADESDLNVAQRNLAQIEKRGPRGRRDNTGWLDQSLKQIDSVRARVIEDASNIQAEANRGLDLKRNLSSRLQDLSHQYDQIRSFDFAPVQGVVRRAETDWPAKKDDLEMRLATIEKIPADAGSAWTASADARAAAGGGGAAVDYAVLYSTEETLHQAQAELPRRVDDLKNLTGQLYNSWDKILEDLDEDRQGNRRVYDEKVKTVTTHLIDVAAKKSEVSTTENWSEIPEATYRSLANNLGMTIQHKPAGVYDSEAEQTAQPPGYAYIAPPSQGRNEYGYWEHRDGGMFWTFFPQYLLLREVLWGRSYQPIPTFEWQNYHTAQSRGQTYYGHDTVTNAPKYGSHGTFTAKRYGTSRYLQTGGGFGSSKYSSGSGSGFGSSRYSTGAPKPGGSFHSRDSAPHRFGSSGPASSGRRFGSSPSRSPGRSFGRRR